MLKLKLPSSDNLYGKAYVSNEIFKLYIDWFIEKRRKGRRAFKKAVKK